MLMAINPFDIIHTGETRSKFELEDTVYILDTDDLSVESINGKLLFEYMKSGLRVRNILLEDRLSMGSFCFFWEYITICRGEAIETTDGLFQMTNNHSFLLGGKNISYSKVVAAGGTIIELVSDGESMDLCIYTTDKVMIDMGVGYVYRVNDYLVMRNLMFSREVVSSEPILTTIIFDLNGEVIGVVPDKRVASSVLVPSRDSVFVAKFNTVWGERY